MDTGAPDLTEVEHLVHLLDDMLDPVLGRDAPATFVSTHLARSPTPHFAVVLGWPAPYPTPAEVGAALVAGIPGLTLVDEESAVTSPALVPAAAAALREHRERTAGRLARYPGRAEVERVTTAGDVVALSCIDAVEGLAGVEVTASSGLDLSGFARPTWRDGSCTLLVQHGRDGMLIAFEVRDQQACCADH